MTTIIEMLTKICSVYIYEVYMYKVICCSFTRVLQLCMHFNLFLQVGSNTIEMLTNNGIDVVLNQLVVTHGSEDYAIRMIKVVKFMQ